MLFYTICEKWKKIFGKREEKEEKILQLNMSEGKGQKTKGIYSMKNGIDLSIIPIVHRRISICQKKNRRRKF